LKGKAAKPYREGGCISGDQHMQYYFLCKGKRRLTKGTDDDKLAKYLNDFQCLVEKYRTQ
ncbi:MAG: hypothetical protein K2N90_06615, partial [Lachnospiraceae bacterium]|nr:hypothetical protein [Lachnospiraceae bacterium]